MTNEERWITNYKALKVYIDEHHHLPSKDSGLNARYPLNWLNTNGSGLNAD